MTKKRICCAKCGRPLVDGYAFTVEGIQCACGHYTDISRGQIVEDETEFEIPHGRKERRRYKRERNVICRERWDI